MSGAASGLGAQAHWGRIGAGVGFALVAGATFGLVLALTQHEVADLDGRLRTAITMGIVGVLALLGSFTQGGLHWPDALAGWWGLAALTLLYGTAFTIMFTLLPKLGVVGSSPILNVEPVAALAHGLAAARPVDLGHPGGRRTAGGGRGDGAGLARDGASSRPNTPHDRLEPHRRWWRRRSAARSG